MRRSTIRTRCGMSILEFLGCLSAMVGGVFLGSMYLGVDLKRMGLAVLKQANVIDAGNEAGEDDGYDAASPQALAESEVAEAPSQISRAPAKVAAKAAGDSASDAAVSDGDGDRNEPAAAPSTAELIASLPPREDLIALTDEQRAALTQAYWKALDECMKEEVKNRTASLREDGNWQLFDYLTCRKQGHEQAAAFIQQLNLRGVDPHVSAYAKTALGWHQDGIKLFSRALDLLTDAPTAQLSGPFAQSWQSAATQHQMEERLVREKHGAVQHYLNHARAQGAAATATAEQPQPTTGG